jgi:hypothetical protein
MNQSKSIGITLFGISYALLAIIFLCVSLYPVFLWAIDSPKLDEYLGDEISFEDARYIYAALAVPPVLLFVSSILLFKLNVWGTRLSLIALIMQMLPMGVFGMLLVLVVAVHIIYFTRPKVKELFAADE